MLMLIKPAAAWAAGTEETVACIGLSWWGCWDVMGPVVRRPPQTGPKQPAGGIEEAPCCTDWPDSSDSSGEDRLSTGRWEEDYLSSRNGTPSSSLHHPAKPLTLTSNPTPRLRCLFILLTFFFSVSLLGPRQCLKSYALHVMPWTWTAARILSTLFPWPAL